MEKRSEHDMEAFFFAGYTRKHGMLKPKELPTSFEVHLRYPMALNNKRTIILEPKYWLNPKPQTLCYNDPPPLLPSPGSE